MLVVGILVRMHLALGFLIFGLSVVTKGHRQRDIDLGNAKIPVESRQHAGLIGIGGIGKYRGGRGRRMGHLGIDLLLRQAGKTSRAPSSQVGCGRILG